MFEHFFRGWLLHQQGRHHDAIVEFQQHLLTSPDDARTHALLSDCYRELDRHYEATEHAHKAIAIEPEASTGHRALAFCLLARNRDKEAIASIDEALRLDPEDCASWQIKALIKFRQGRWADVIEATDRGLAIEPEDGLCTNLRAQALMHLGDRAAAAKTMESALARSPEDSFTHANMGWSKLNANQPQEAFVHFREALRIEPENEWARAGIIEAMKSRNILYRYLLQYFLWASRLPSQWQWGLIVGGFIGNRVLMEAAEQNPALRPVIYPITGLYIAFAILTWLAPSFFNLILRFDRFGRHVLSRDQVWDANLLAIGLIPPLLFTLIGAVTGDLLAYVGAVFWALMLIPMAAIFRCDAGWPRHLMTAGTGVLLVLNLLSVYPLIIYLGVNLQEGLWTAPLIGSFVALKSRLWVFIGLQFLAIYLVSVRVTR